MTSKAAKIAELQAELVEIKAAIKKAQRIQSYSAGGTSVTSGSLKELYAERDRLEARIAILSGGSPIKTPVFGDAK